MKKVSQLLALVLLSGIFLLTSCSKNPEKVLPSKDGKWNGTYTETISLAGTGSSSASGTFTATFAKGGTGTWVDPTSSPESFSWTYNESSKMLSIIESGQDAVNFTVSDAKRNSETWTANYTFDDGVDTYTVSITASVKRAD